MAIINLKRYYYPLITKDTFMEVPDDVAQAFAETEREGRREDHRKWYYGTLSLDQSEGLENHAMFFGLSPEEMMVKGENDAAYEVLINALKENAALLAFLQENSITSMQELHEKVSDMNSDYYDLRGKIVSAERRIAVLKERLDMAEKYQQYKPVREKVNKLNPKKRTAFEENHQAELTLFDAAHRYLDKQAASGEKITPKAWRAEMEKLTAQKDADYLQMRKMRDKIKAVENLKKTAEQLAKAEQERPNRREQER